VRERSVKSARPSGSLKPAAANSTNPATHLLC
jgi:hypothetical protein